MAKYMRTDLEQQYKIGNYFIHKPNNMNDKDFLIKLGYKRINESNSYYLPIRNADGEFNGFFVFTVDNNGYTAKKVPTKIDLYMLEIADELLGISSKDIKERLKEEVDVEAIQLLYKQAVKVKDEFTTKEKTLDWFLKKQLEVVDINHLLKIDHVLITVI